MGKRELSSRTHLEGVYEDMAGVCIQLLLRILLIVTLAYKAKQLDQYFIAQTPAAVENHQSNTDAQA